MPTLEQINRIRAMTGDKPLTQLGVSPTSTSNTQSFWDRNGIVTPPPKQYGQEPQFKASIGGAGTIPSNIAKTFGNIPSNAANLGNFALESTAGNFGKSLEVTGDIYRNRGFVEGSKDIAGGFGDTLTKIGEAPGKFLVGQKDKTDLLDALKPVQETLVKQREQILQMIIDSRKAGKDTTNLKKALITNKEGLDSINSQIGTKEDRTNKEIQTYTDIAKYPIERPLDAPLALYGGKGATGKDIISDTAGLVTRGADTSIAGLASKTKTGVTNAVTSAVKGKVPKAVDSLEEKYIEWSSGTKPGKKLVNQANVKTDLLNKAGTEGKTPMRVLAEAGIVPKTSGTKFNTFDQAEEFRQGISKLREINIQAIREVENSTPKVRIDDLENQAIALAKSDKNIASGDSPRLIQDIQNEFDNYRITVGDEMNLTQVNAIKEARWNNAFGNKGFIGADKLRKDADYLIAKASQRTIEDVAESAGHTEVAQLNREIGSRLEASKFLESLDSKILKGGRLGKYVGTIIGSSLGQTIPGKILGAIGGNAVADLLIKSSVSSPIRRLILSRLAIEDPETYKATVKWLAEQDALRETRLALPPSDTIYAEPTQGGMPYTPNKQGFSTSPVVETGQASNRSINDATATPISNDNNIPINPIIDHKADNVKSVTSPPKGEGGILETIKNTPNKEGGFVSISGYKNTGELTTKILKDLEGRTTVSRQYILDATNRGELKQVERDLTREVLSTMKGDTINVKEFADKVKAELLPLKRTGEIKRESQMHENTTLDKSIRGDVANYREHIYQSPIKTSAGNTHFPGKAPNYFGHTRVEEMADGKTVRVIEGQTDLYQKGNLEKEMGDIFRQSKNDDESFGAIGRRLGNGNEIKGNEIARQKNQQELSKLQQYDNRTSIFRMFREEIKQAAKDGKTKLQFPTGETAMKIEGLGQGGTGFWTEGEGVMGNPLKIDELKVGKEVKQGMGQDWIITDVLGDGKFKAIPRNAPEGMTEDFPSPDDFIKYIKDNDGNVPMGMEYMKEQFDISGKVDKNNPIYKFYEKDVSNYLKKFGGKRITDKQGVEWTEVPIKKEWGKEPVDAFGKIMLNPLFLGAGISAAAVAGAQLLKKK